MKKMMITLLVMTTSCLPSQEGEWAAHDFEIEEAAKAINAETAPQDRKAEITSAEEMFGWIEDICALGYRRPGTQAERRTAEYVQEKFVEFGLKDVHLEPTTIKSWDAEQWHLAVDGEEIPSFFMPFSELTGSDGITGELAYLGEGSIDDFESYKNRIADEITDQGRPLAGRIVVVDVRFGLRLFDGKLNLTGPVSWVISNWDAYERAVENGAAGFVGILRDYWDRNTYYAPADNFTSKPIEKRKLPGLWVSRSDGDRLVEIARAKDRVRADLTLVGTRDQDVEATNVVGMLPGKSDDIILIHTHHDAAFNGAVEDASGVAEMLALAKYFGQVPQKQRQKTLVFLSATGHFYDYVGNRSFVQRHREDWMPKIVADVCVEHIAKRFEEVDGKVVDTGRYETSFILATGLLSVYARYAAWDNGIQNSTWIVPIPFGIPGFPTDARNYYDEGIPIVSFISAPQYVYDLIDTPDKVAKGLLQPVAKTFLDIVEYVDATPSFWLR